MFYKVVYNGEIIDALNDLQKVMYSPESRMILRCTDKNVAQGIISYDGEYIWHVEGWPQFPQDLAEVAATVALAEITEEEFDSIREALDEGEDIPDPDDGQMPDEDPDRPMSVQEMRIRIAELEGILNVIMGVSE